MKTKVMNLILAAACTNDDNNVAVDNNPVAARITAGLAGDAVVTGATITDWTDGGSATGDATLPP